MTSSTRMSSADDFDFIIGDWHVHHRRLKERLIGCTEWVEFEGTSATGKILGGFGNLEDHCLSLSGDAYRAVALRSFDPVTATWSIWWLDGRSPHQLDTPVVGAFEHGRGLFFANDILNGRPIRVRFLWLPIDANTARWEQAFSDDGGTTWETNWTMDFIRDGA